MKYVRYKKSAAWYDRKAILFVKNNSEKSHKCLTIHKCEDYVAGENVRIM